MGCSPQIGKKTKDNSTKGNKKNEGIVEIEIPSSRKIRSLKYSLNKLEKEDSLMNLMNVLFFREKQNQSIDVCFQSLYCEVDDRHHYYVQRLMNVEMEFLEKPFYGKMWVLYLGEKNIDWDYAVNTDMKIDLSEEPPKLLWKYEKLKAENGEKSTIKPKNNIHSNQDLLRIAVTETTINEGKSSTAGSKNIQRIRKDSSNRRNNPKQGIKNNNILEDKRNTCSQVRFEEDIILNTEESNVQEGEKSARNGKYLSQEKVSDHNTKNNRTHRSNSSRNINELRINTDEDNKNIHAPLPTEAAEPWGENIDTQDVNCLFEDAPGREGDKIVEGIDENGAILSSDLIPKE